MTTESKRVREDKSKRVASLADWVDAIRLAKQVHNHGTEEGAGLGCTERVINGKLVGDCLLASARDQRGRVA